MFANEMYDDTMQFHRQVMQHWLSGVSQFKAELPPPVIPHNRITELLTTISAPYKSLMQSSLTAIDRMLGLQTQLIEGQSKDLPEVCQDVQKFGFELYRETVTQHAQDMQKIGEVSLDLLSDLIEVGQPPEHHD